MQQMPPEKVIEIYSTLEELGIPIWIDGGWAKDAHIGRQTREHRDLDFAVERKNLDKLVSYFIGERYSEVERPEENKWDIVLGDENGHELDIHAFDFDTNGQVLDKPYWDAYESDSLNAFGNIAGMKVHCVSLDHLLKTLDGTKRELREKDLHDLPLLLELKNKQVLL